MSCRFSFSSLSFLFLEGQLDIRKNFPPAQVVGHWHRLPRDVMESLSLDVFTNHLDVVLRKAVSGATMMVSGWLD